MMHSPGMARNHRERRAAHDAEGKRLDRQKPFAGLVMVIGGVSFIGNYIGIAGPPNLTFETICMIAVIVGGLWFWHLRSEKERNSRRSMEQAKAERDRPTASNEDL